MRLLNTKSKTLEEFHSSKIPPYAILSHTWGEGEISFQDMVRGEAPQLQGYKKIVGCCNQAASDGYKYVWIDTCCIDKTSSAELSESINSMFRWYRKAHVCYAYLSDVDSILDPTDLQLAIAKSRWFTRGWTLQELIGPSNVIFYNCSWDEIGTKAGLAEIISNITGADVPVLLKGGKNNFSDYSIAKRMFWASRRETTRVEDEAYCLMGLFGVNMPLIYGEGKMAFFRLQDEIMRHSDDHSLFAWKASTDTEIGLLASSPREFSESGKVDRIATKDSRPYSITNKGVQITLPLLNTPNGEGFEFTYWSDSMPALLTHRKVMRPLTRLINILGSKTVIAVLNCQPAEMEDYIFGAILDKQSGYADDNFYLRHSRGPSLILLERKIFQNHTALKQIFVGFPERGDEDVSIFDYGETSQYYMYDNDNDMLEVP
ncbi:HET-domain-containing protein [Glonium stellatum]|uniref:HET-domain-containing protein n=1 Tax=Glonium stellatum TaxID=574774 RepID=A0A8E2ENQ1_9PEZI|nr:HET-domain-containing protein [Glonium stellatum]